MRVLVAPDKFKGSLPASGVAAAVAQGLRSVRADLDVVLVPVADGGDGTVDAAVSTGFTRVPVETVGPTGEPVGASYAMRDEVAVVELADVVGLDRLPGGRLDALGASTYGLGLAIRDAVGRGATEVVLGLGGSASTDGGVGMVQALGATVVDGRGRPVGRGGGALGDVVAIDVAKLRETLGSARVVVASDVDNPLLGERGAAAVFGPQKGAGPDEVAALDAALARWADVVRVQLGVDHADTPGAGAAGGTGFAAVALLGAEIRPGIELMLEMVGFHAALEGARLVVTGEGSLDEQSLAGKAPVGVSAAAGAAGVPVVAVCGRCLLSAQRLAGAGIAAAYALSDLEPDVARSMAVAGPLLERVGRTIAAEWLS